MSSILNGVMFSGGMHSSKDPPWIQIGVLALLLIGCIILLVVLTRPSPEMTTEEPTGTPQSVQTVQSSTSGTSLSTQTL